MARYGRLSWGFRWRMWRSEHPRRWRLGFDADYLLTRVIIAFVVGVPVMIVWWIVQAL